PSFHRQSRPLSVSSREFPMAPCSMCETPLRDGAGTCPTCGTPVVQAPTARAGEGQVRVALDAARRAEAVESGRGIDMSTAKKLIEAADRALGGGEPGKALDLSRAARRAVEIGRQRARVEAEIARAEARIRESRETGIDTSAPERILELARNALYEGTFEDAEKLLASASLTALEGRQERHFKSLLERAAQHIAHAKERGGDVARAEEAHSKAKQAASKGAFGEARRHADTAVGHAIGARKYSRAEAVLVNAQAAV